MSKTHKKCFTTIVDYNLCTQSVIKEIFKVLVKFKDRLSQVHVIFLYTIWKLEPHFRDIPSDITRKISNEYDSTLKCWEPGGQWRHISIIAKPLSCKGRLGFPDIKR